MEEYIAFNKALKFFIRCSIESFPHMKELKMLLVTYKTLKTISKKKPCKIFLQILTEDFHKAIMDKDESFFMTHQVECQDIIGYLKNAVHREWSLMSEEDKDKIWQHLQVLLILSKKAENLKHAISI